MASISKSNFKSIKDKVVAFLALAMAFIIFVDMAIAIYEYINIGLLKHTANYPWGKEEKDFWNYETPQIYARWMFISAISSLCVLIVNFLLRKKAMYALAVSVGYIIIMGYIFDCKAEARYSFDDEDIYINNIQG
jgi:hypothetical protein